MQALLEETKEVINVPQRRRFKPNFVPVVKEPILVSIPQIYDFHFYDDLPGTRLQAEISKQTNDATLLMSKISTAKFLSWNKAEFDRYVDALRNRDLDDV